jgi:hypothetical protein
VIAKGINFVFKNAMKGWLKVRVVVEKKILKIKESQDEPQLSTYHFYG